MRSPQHFFLSDTVAAGQAQTAPRDSFARMRSIDFSCENMKRGNNHA
jgi:hypothetical protein